MSAHADAAIAAVRATWPDLRWSRVDVPDQGLDHGVAVLAGPSGGPLRADDPAFAVARLAVSPGVVGRAATEAAILGTIAPATPAALPAAYATDGASLTLARHVPGDVVTAEEWGRLDRTGRAMAVDGIAATLSALHSMDPGDPVAAALGPSWFREKFDSLRERAARHLEPVLSGAERDAVAAIFGEAADVFIREPAAPHPIHGDLHETHLRWDGRRIGLIDFSDMTLADPAIDLAHLPGISPELARAVGTQLGGDARGLAERAGVYARWDAVFLMTDHLATGRTPASVARPLFRRALADRP